MATKKQIKFRTETSIPGQTFFVVGQIGTQGSAKRKPSKNFRRKTIFVEKFSDNKFVVGSGRKRFNTRNFAVEDAKKKVRRMFK